MASKPPQPEFRLGVRTRLFNYNLWKAIRDTGKTTAAVAADLGIKLYTLYRYQSFRAYPAEEMQLRFALYFQIPADVLFPESIAGVRLKRQPEPLALTADEAIAAGMVTEPDDPVLEAEHTDLRKQLGEVLETLSELEIEGKPIVGHPSAFGCPGQWIHNPQFMGADVRPRPCPDEDCQREFVEWPGWLKRQSEGRIPREL